MQKLLTIVVPVYKVEDYINKCLDSLIVSSEMMEKLEVIIVNDGTPDRSAELSREYVNKYPHTFRQIDKENGGHGSAWNVGLKEATGKYIKFLDSDDWFSNLETLICDLENNDADVVLNPFVKEFANNGKSVTVDTPIKTQGPTAIDGSFWGQAKERFNGINFWSGTYKASILKPLYPLFAERTMFDDYIITWAPLVYGRTCITLDYPVYHYLIGRDGQSMSMAQQRRGAVSYTKCFTHYETVRSRIEEDNVPSNLLKMIDEAIAGYASYVFSYMVFLPYKESEQWTGYLWKKYLSGLPHKTKQQKRYSLLPFLLFYTLEHLRNIKNRR